MTVYLFKRVRKMLLFSFYNIYLIFYQLKVLLLYCFANIHKIVNFFIILGQEITQVDIALLPVLSVNHRHY